MINLKQLTLAIALPALMMTGSGLAFTAAKPTIGTPLQVTQVKALKHKMRSAGFLIAKLEKLGVAVHDTRREGQVYLFLIEHEGTTAIVAVDGYSSEIIGVNVLTYATGVAERPANSVGIHFVDFTYEFGYEVEQTTYETYSEVSSVEVSSTESYSEVSYEESEEVSYVDITYDEGTNEEDVADLDQGDEGDAAGDAEADIQDDAGEAEDAGSSDDGEN